MKLRRKIRWSTAAFFFLSGIISATWSSRIPEIQSKFHLSDAQWGGVLFALPIGLVTGLAISSYLIARFNSAKMMTVGGIAFSILLYLLGIAPTVFTLVLVLYCFGLSRNLFTMSINTNSIEVQRLYNKPIIATFHGVWSVACFCAAAIGTFMIANDIHPATHFIIISFTVATGIFLIRRNGNTKKSLAPERRPFFIKPDNYLLILGCICFCSMMCEGTMFDWGVNYFDKVVKGSKNVATVGYTSFIIAMAAARLIGDKIIAVLGLHKMLLVNGILMGIGFLIAVVFPYVWSAAFGFLLIGLGDSIIVPSVYSLAGKSVKMPANYAIASVTMIGYSGFLAAPLVVGSLSQAFGMSSSFILMAALSFAISALSIILAKRNEVA